MCFLPAQQLRIGKDLLQAAEVADTEGEDGLSRVAGKMPGNTGRKGQHHLSGDLHDASGMEGEERSCYAKCTLKFIPDVEVYLIL